LNHVKQLVGQTAVYGLGIVLPRLLNYLLLTPFYTRIFLREQYGIITELYAYVVFLMVILTYGLETGLFRFAGKTGNKDSVYKTALLSISITTLIFILAGLAFSGDIAALIDYPDKSIYIKLLVWIIALDAFSAIPFAKIRIENQASKYAIIRIVEILVNLLANWFLLFYAPRHYVESDWLNSFYNPDFGVGYVLVSNLAGSAVKTLLLYKEIFFRKGHFVFTQWKEIMAYSLPLLIAGLAGTVNEAIDRVMLKYMIPVEQAPLEQLGVYGANYKLAVLMTLFIQMFRYAAEPFFFSKQDRSDAKIIYASVMKYFVAAGMLIFLVVMLYIDLFKLFIGSDFREGIFIVPVILLANLFMGIFYNQSIWYKLQNLTRYGAYLVFGGALITFLVNYLFIPKYGYLASAWGHLISYSAMIVASFFLGRKYYDIKYDLKNIFSCIFIGILVYLMFANISFNSLFFEYLCKTLSILALMAVYIAYERKNLRKSTIRS
jgi:O-antigen/teichoic acid export membrane protein